MNKSSIIPQKSKDKYDKWHFSPAVESQGFVFVSGCTGNKSDGTISDNVEEQFRQSFLTIEESLREAGITFDHVVEITSYHIGLKKHLRTFMKVRAEATNNLPLLLASFSSGCVRKPRRCPASPTFSALPEKKLAA